MSPRILKYRPRYWVEISGGQSVLSLLQRKAAEGLLSDDHFHLHQDRITMLADKTDLRNLKKFGCEVQVLADAYEAARQAQTESLPLQPLTDSSGLVTGFVSQYLDVSAATAQFSALHSAHPNCTQWLDLSFPTSGYDGSIAGLRGPATIKLLRINTTPAAASKPGMLVIAGTHAREWAPVLCALEFAAELLNNYSPGSTNPAVQTINALVDGLDILIIPTLNPDGINYSHHDDAMWRKNRRPPAVTGTTCPGVDVNRNYSIYWGGAGSSADLCDDNYHGTTAFSEPEDCNIRTITENYPNLLTAVDIHSFGDALYRPQPTGGPQISSEPVEALDHAIYIQLENCMNAAISATSSGKTYQTGSTNNHAGTSDEYLFFAHRIFAFDLECGQNSFQPPIAQAFQLALEVAAAMRALGSQTLTLSGQFINPLALVQVIDQSGSMTASGFAAPVLQNAKRMIDLMSLGDQAAAVSFNEAASIVLPRMPLGVVGDYSTARNALDQIHFGGWTSIGAGLQVAANQLAGVNGQRAILLLSDGFENRAPFVRDILPGLPANTPIFTLALGPSSDQALLAQIAATSRGKYFYCPDELDLHEIYNYARAAATDQALLLNERVMLLPNGQKQVIQVEPGARELFISASWDGPGSLRLVLIPPESSASDTNRIRLQASEGSYTLRLCRPFAGTWTVEILPVAGEKVPEACILAAFVRSPLHLSLVCPRLPGSMTALGQLIYKDGPGLGSVLTHKITGLTWRATSAMPTKVLSELPTEWLASHPTLPKLSKIVSQVVDAWPMPILQALTVRQVLTSQTHVDPLTSRITSLECCPPTKDQLKHLDGFEVSGTTSIRLPTLRPGSTDNLRLMVSGHLEGRPFTRTAFLSLRNAV